MQVDGEIVVEIGHDYSPADPEELDTQQEVIFSEGERYSNQRAQCKKNPCEGGRRGQTGDVLEAIPAVEINFLPPCPLFGPHPNSRPR